MNYYPAMRASMGTWDYFVLKMTMRELSDSVKFATDVHDDQTLDQAIQRVLNESRVNSDIVTYLGRQEDRFFSSLVVAAFGGSPRWYPVTMEDDERFSLFRDDPRLNQTFGVLAFDGTHHYYALDGQHRLAAIKRLIDPKAEKPVLAPRNFGTEEVSVIVVVPKTDETNDSFMLRYRRLFGNLNRHAKTTDQVTNIIMDEDDVFAILTRRIITDHGFFQSAGPQKNSVRIKTKKGKNLKSKDSFFTSLETLYEMNIALLTTTNRSNDGWDDKNSNFKAFRRFRPSDDVIDALFEELKIYWDAILAELPVLYEEPSRMKEHRIREGDDGFSDNAMFWPIGQELLVSVARRMLDLNQENPDKPTLKSVKSALRGLDEVEWEFHCVPWRHLLLIPAADDFTKWRIRNEERKDASNLVGRILKWQLGLDELSAKEVGELRLEWEGMLLPALAADVIDDLWKQIEVGAYR